MALLSLKKATVLQKNIEGLVVGLNFFIIKSYCTTQHDTGADAKSSAAQGWQNIARNPGQRGALWTKQLKRR